MVDPRRGIGVAGGLKLRWHHLHVCGRGLRLTALACTLLVAGLEAGGQLSLPLLASHPQWVEAELSHLTHREIRLGSLQGHWSISGPRFVMRDISASLGPTATPLRLNEAILQLDFGGWMPGRHFINIYGRGLALDLLREANGDWRLNGIGIAGHDGSQQADFGHLKIGLWFEDLQLNVEDRVVGQQYALQADALRFVRSGDVLRFGAHLHRAGARGRITAAGVFASDGHQGRVWLCADGVNLHSLLAGIDLNGYGADSGHGHGSTWLDWNHGQIRRSVTRLDFTDLALSNAAGRTSIVPAIHGLADLRRVHAGYSVHWSGDDHSHLDGIINVSKGQLSAVHAWGADLALQPLLPWVALAKGLPPGLADWLGNGAPAGRLGMLGFDWDRSAASFTGHVRLDAVGIHALGRMPGIDHLSGELRADSSGFSVQLPAQTAKIDWPKGYPHPFALNQLQLAAAGWRDESGWHVGIDDFRLAGMGLQAQVNGELDLPAPGHGLISDVYARLGDMDVETVKSLLPEVLSAHTRQWIDHALSGGRLSDISALLHGDLAEWPFAAHQGRFEAHARLDGANLSYAQHWPSASDLGADLDFINDGLHVDIDTAQALGLQLTQASLDIPHFKDIDLQLQLQAKATAADALNFVSHSPIASDQAETLAKMQLAGQMQFVLQLSMPLKQREDMQLQGQGRWLQGGLNAPEWRLALDHLNGGLSFDRHGFIAGPMQAQFHGQPVHVQLAIGAATGQPDTSLSAALTGHFSLAQLTQGYPELSWLAPLTQGVSAYTLGFTIRHPQSGSTQQQLQLDSNLQATALLLPAPLNKSASAAWPLHVGLSLPIQGAQVELGLGNVLQGRLRLPASSQSELAGTLRLGQAAPGALPSQGLRIVGHSEVLDATGWAQFVAGGQGGHGPGLDGVSISSDDATLFGAHFKQLGIQVVPMPSQMQISLMGPALAGMVTVPTRELNKRGLTMRMQRVHWPKVEISSATNADLTQRDDAVMGGDVNPAALPPLHLWIKDLRLGAATLGEARLEALQVPGGLHIDPLQTLAPSVQISGVGDWLGDAKHNHSHLKLQFAAHDLGAMLAALGYPNLFDGGATHAALDATWPGSPLTPYLASADGHLAIDIKNGSLPDLPPGAGARVLGLVSVLELPRRLSLNFSDVFNRGFGFDAIKGQFQLLAGQAWTRDLHIESPAAHVAIQGRAGLATRDYDEQISVTPHVGNGLPVFGAVFGPIGIAAGLVAQGLFGSQINQSMLREYHLGGSWDKPELVPLHTEHAPAAAGKAAPDSSSHP